MIKKIILNEKELIRIERESEKLINYIANLKLNKSNVSK